MTQGQQYFADGMPLESEAQTSGAALRLGFEAWEGRSEMEVALVEAAAAGGGGKNDGEKATIIVKSREKHWIPVGETNR
jgi:hypothetical protein